MEQWKPLKPHFSSDCHQPMPRQQRLEVAVLIEILDVFIVRWGFGIKWCEDLQRRIPFLEKDWGVRHRLFTLTVAVFCDSDGAVFVPAEPPNTAEFTTLAEFVKYYYHTLVSCFYKAIALLLWILCHLFYFYVLYHIFLVLKDFYYFIQIF